MHATVNGIRLFFDVEGSKLVADGGRMREKPTLILFHGGLGLGDHSSFKPLFGQLREVARIVYLDLRGCGRSDMGPVEQLTVEQLADDVRCFCDVLGIEKAVVLGQSSGDFVAMMYGARHAEHPAKLILASTQARVVPESVLRVIRRRGTEEAVRAAEAYLHDPSDGSAFRAWVRHVLPLYNHALQDPDGGSRNLPRMDTWKTPLASLVSAKC